MDTEREPDHTNLTGPTLDLQLPIFDQGQGAVGRLSAQYRQARRRLEAAETNARSEIREAMAVVAARRGVALRYRQLLPRQRGIVEQTQVQYNAMQSGGFDLLNARERELTAERSSIEAWRDYWIARTELERALNGGDFGGVKFPRTRPHGKFYRRERKCIHPRRRNEGFRALTFPFPGPLTARFPVPC